MTTPPRLAALFALCSALCSALAAAQSPPPPAPPPRDAQRAAPSAPERAGLELLAAEVDGFAQRGDAFRRSLDGLLGTTHAAQLARVRAAYARQLAAERDAENAARRAAISEFERFLARYPAEPEHTPDVMFRLAELYYDEAFVARLDAEARLDRARAARESEGRSIDDLPPPPPIDFRCSVLLYRHVVSRFPDYRLRDVAHYLLGWTLREMGRESEAVTAWRGLVCPARFQYTPALDLTAPLDRRSTESALACPGLFALLRARDPALERPAAAPSPPAPVAASDYAACAPVAGPQGGPTRYAAEVWYYLGDFHFDSASGVTADPELATAIAAYEASMRASEPPDAAPPGTRRGPFWTRALYKIGWSHFRTPEGNGRALAAFARLLDALEPAAPDATTRGTRGDTLRWIGVILSEGSWGGARAVADHAACQPLVERLAEPPADAARPFDCAGLLRAANPADLPQDRAWTADAWVELADAYFAEARHFEAIAAYRRFLDRYPLHAAAPRAREQIAAAYDAQREPARALAARTDAVTQFPRWRDAQQRSGRRATALAERRVREALRDAAVRYHSHAADARRAALALDACAAGRPAPGSECEAPHSARDRRELARHAADAHARARAAYDLAAAAYDAFAAQFPDDPDTYEFRHNRADALFWAGRYPQAAAAYAAVRDSDEDDRLRAPAALMAVAAREADVRELARTGQLDACTAARAGADPDPPAGAPDPLEACRRPPLAQGARAAAPLPLPAPVAALLEARRAYTERVPAVLDTPAALAPVLAPDARDRPPLAPRMAYLRARTLARFGHLADAETAYRAVLRAACGDPEVESAAYVDLRNLFVQSGRDRDTAALAREGERGACRGVPSALIERDLADARLREAQEVFQRAEQAGTPAYAVARYDAAAAALRAAVDARPDHPDAPRALVLAAVALERAGRFESAARTYERVLAAYDDLQSRGEAPGAARTELTGAARQERVDVLETSAFRAGLSRERALDYDRALPLLTRVARDPRLAGARDHADHAHDALATVALIHTHLGHTAAAREAWLALAAQPGDPGERALARLRAAEVSSRAREWPAAIAALRAFRREVPVEPATAALHVRAQAELADALGASGDAAGQRRALDEVAQLFRASGQRPGSAAAVDAARALFAPLDRAATAFEARALTAGTPSELAAQVRALDAALEAIDTRAVEVFDLLGGESSVAALVRSGEAQLHVAREQARVGELVTLDAAQQRAIDRARASAARLETLARALEARDARTAARLRAQAEAIRARVDQAHTDAVAALQARFDALAASHRQSAVRALALAVHLATRSNLPTPWAARARALLRDEDNRAVLEPALRAMPAPLARATGFAYTPGMFDQGAPGAALTEPSLVATPPLARAE